ncbi:MAG: DUF58 domain-containing protein [Betaproteobacteria bacterium]
MNSNPSVTPSVTALAQPPLWQLRARWRHWWQSRLVPADAVTLVQNRIYVLPSPPGLMLASTLAVLLATSINYQLNLGYLLTFLLAGCAAVSLQIGHGTLRGLGLHLLTPESQFAGTPLMLGIKLHNPGRKPRYSIGLAVWGSGRWAWSNVPAQGEALVQISFAPGRRGVYPVPLLTAETRFPLGTFRIWTLWQPASQVLVYPAPEPQPPPLPAGEPRGSDAKNGGQHVNTGELEGVRAYRRGDPLKMVVWKKVAKSGELVSRDRSPAQAEALWLDARLTGLADREQQLSRLCAWVLRADQLGLDYGLRLRLREIGVGSGAAHKQRCLEALARD